MNRVIELLIGFGRAGILGYGGGPAMIPLIESEAVDTFSWINQEEFADALAFGNSLPGPIATKMAGYIGFKTAGIIGSVTAVFATILPTILVMILFSSLLAKFSKSYFLKGMINGVKPVVFVLLALLAFDYVKFATGSWTTFLFAAVALVAIRAFQIHPAIIIAVALVSGGFLLQPK